MMEFRGLLVAFVVIAAECGAQSFYRGRGGCTLKCLATEGYAVRFGRELCMCRRDICAQHNCGRRGCVVKRLPFYGDWRTCGPEPSPVPVLNRVETVPPPTDAGSTNSGCSQPKVTGRCRALMVRFYYDPTDGTCKQFAFGGCDANQNNFLTIEECQRTCMNAVPRLPVPNSGTNSNGNSNTGNSNSGNSNSGNSSSNANGTSGNGSNGKRQLNVQSPADVAQFLRNILLAGK